MKISIITATFNSSKTISDCLQSVVQQNYTEIEHIIIDGKSTDQTLEIVKDYSNKYGLVKYISESDNGIYDALNKGISISSGDVIGFVHSDDLLADEDVIAEIASAFKENNVDGVYADLKYVGSSDINKIIRYWTSKPFSHDLLKKGWMPAHPSLFLKKEVYKERGNFNTSFKIAADYDFILRIFSVKNYNFHCLNRVTYLMRSGGASNKDLKSIILKTKEDIKALRINKINTPLLVVFRKNLSKLPQLLFKNS